MENKSKTFIFVGKSGSGKGTQVELLKKYMKSTYPNLGEYGLAMGDILRSFIKSEGYAQEKIRNIINSGNLAPDVISSSLWILSLLSSLKENDNLYIDGIPRSPYQSDIVASVLEFYNRSNAIIINIEVSDSEVEKRMITRNRPDDNKESIASRLKFYEDTVVSAINHLKEKSGFHYLEINGERSIEEIHNDIISRLKTLNV